ncbi:MAG: hypothetical protein KAH10_05895 [Flavobacteriales bacterium]|nr:hypothetical protein [Flavobacteriales bacterium]
MKTSRWIKLIGILCIVFGSLGIIYNISFFFTTQWINDTWPEVTPERLKWLELQAYFGFFVNTIYLIAGVFFLRKKPFSLNLMYGALTISILYVVIPLFFIEPNNSFLFVLIGPIIDLVLLIGVYRIRNYYYESPSEVVKLFGEITLAPAKLKLMTLLGVLFISIPILMQCLWIYAFNLADNQFDRVAILYSYLPEFLHGQYVASYLALTFCLLAIILSRISMKLPGVLWKSLNVITLIISSILLLLSLFQLM